MVRPVEKYYHLLDFFNSELSLITSIFNKNLERIFWQNTMVVLKLNNDNGKIPFLKSKHKSRQIIGLVNAGTRVT